MKLLRNEKGVTLIESLASVLIIASASSIFVTFMIGFNFQKDQQENDMHMNNVMIQSVEDYRYSIVTNQLPGTDYSNTLTVNYGNKDYIVDIEVTQSTSPINLDWQVGKLQKLKVEVTDGKTKKAVTTYVYK